MDNLGRILARATVALALTLPGVKAAEAFSAAQGDPERLVCETDMDKNLWVNQLLCLGHDCNEEGPQL
jgi:hypothetical protein